MSLSLHCGIGAGDLISFNVGGEIVGKSKRWEYVITGDPVNQVGCAEKQAAAGEIVLVCLLISLKFYL